MLRVMFAFLKKAVVVMIVEVETEPLGVARDMSFSVPPRSANLEAK